MRRAHIPFQLPRNLTAAIKFISPNVYELRAIAQALGYDDHDQHNFTAASSSSTIPSSSRIKDIFSTATNLEAVENRQQLLAALCDIAHFVGERIENVIVTLGSLGVLVYRSSATVDTPFYDLVNGKYLSGRNECNGGSVINLGRGRYYAAEKIGKIRNVSGAGDSFTSGFITAAIQGRSERVCVAVGFEAAKSALNASGAVPKRYFDADHSCWRREGADFEVVQ